MNLWVIFLTGLTTGGLTCLAVQGGLLTSIIASQKGKELAQPTKDTKPSSFDRKDWLPVAMFLGSKLVSHTMLGFLLGALGSVVTLSQNAQLIFQTFSALFMLATACNLLQIHPIFRFVVLQPPRFITRFIRRYSKDGETLFAPAILGFLTVFIPCGVTQAMEVLAINTGHPIQGALLMASFVLGTIPLFSFIGVATAKLSETWKGTFLKLAAFTLLFVSLSSLNGVLEVIQFPVRASIVQNAWVSFWTPEPIKARNKNLAPIVNGSQQVTIDILSNGYSPNYIRVKKDVPVNLTLRSNKVYSCALSFRLNAFGIKEFLNATDQKTVAFTPKQTGTYPFTCSMGMYQGVLEVI